MQPADAPARPELRFHGGQTGAGAAPDERCIRANDCSERALRFAAVLQQPASTSELIASACVARDGRGEDEFPWHADAVCQCVFPCENARGERVDERAGGLRCDESSDRAEIYIEPGADDPTPPAGELRCYPSDRLGRCLLEPSDVPACEPAQPDSCEAACRAFETQWQREAAERHEVEVLSAVCRHESACEAAFAPDQAAGSCFTIVRVDEGCYLNWVDPNHGPFDCDLPAEEIYRRAHYDYEPEAYLLIDGECHECAAPERDEDGGVLGCPG
jgi:hypothetical protein